MTTYRKKRWWPSFQHMYLPCWLHSYSTFWALIKLTPPTLHVKSQTPSLSTLVRPSFEKVLVTFTISQSFTWKGWGQFMLSQSLLVSLPRIVSLTIYRWKARHFIYERVLGLFLIGHRELGIHKQLLTIGYLNIVKKANSELELSQLLFISIKQRELIRVLTVLG